ncbi:hypothetical protein D3C85_470940 [compost metagenome]
MGHSKRKIRALIVVIAVGACAIGWRYWRLSYSEPIFAMTSLTKDMKTLCVGRILVDLPASTTWEARASGARVGNAQVSSQTGVSREQFEVLKEQRWREIQLSKSPTGEEPLHAPERFSPDADSVIFSYGFESIEGPDAFGVYGRRVVYDAQGFKWSNGTLVEFRPQLDGREQIAGLMGRIRARGRDEIPNQPGLCLDGIFVAGYYDFSEREEVSWNFDLPFAQSMRVEVTRVSSPATSFFERDRKSLAEWADFIANAVKPGQTYSSHYYRKNERNVGGLVGDEVIGGEVEGQAAHGYSTAIHGLWEFPGNGPAAPAPKISITMGTPTFETTYVPSPAGGFPRPEDTPDGPLAQDFFEIWDAVISSVRVRPIALAQPPKVTPPAPRITSEQAELDRKSLDAFIAGLPAQDPERKQ